MIVGATLVKAFCEVVGGKILSVILHGIKPEDLKVEVVVGKHGVYHFGGEFELKGHLHALKGSAESAYYGLSDKAAVYLIKIFFIGKIFFHR